MAGLAFIVCEALEAGEWQAEARFLVRSGRGLQGLLQQAGLDGRGLPPDASATVQTDLLFEEGAVSDATFVTFSELPLLTVHAALGDYPRLAAWDGFMRGLEHSGRRSRLVVWFVW
ncbi:hypothetical protein [Deinococcus sp.]|uniref:hypothetical protein n=1 Tax=Deinococcus sp. TaxID=47478 RepID=UPI0025C65CFE|nr:hypothetical protein [Deinococcus sp.]